MGINRRELFSSLSSSFLKGKKDEKKLLRPPYYNLKNDESSLENCKICKGSCKEVCEESIIYFTEDRTPVIDFTYSGCSFCGECEKVCENDVLKLENENKINAKIEINIQDCLSWNQTMCFSCKDPCLDNAIDFLAMFRPQINENCTSCGFCIKYCPTNAIVIK